MPWSAKRSWPASCIINTGERYATMKQVSEVTKLNTRCTFYVKIKKVNISQRCDFGDLVSCKTHLTSLGVRSNRTLPLKQQWITTRLNIIASAECLWSTWSTFHDQSSAWLYKTAYYDDEFYGKIWTKWPYRFSFFFYHYTLSNDFFL